MLIQQGLSKEGNYGSTYRFEAIGENECGVDSQCQGWTLRGYYKVETRVEGDNSIMIDARLKGPKAFRLRGMFGMGWGLDYDSNMKTETFVTMWSF